MADSESGKVEMETQKASNIDDTILLKAHQAKLVRFAWLFEAGMKTCLYKYSFRACSMRPCFVENVYTQRKMEYPPP